ncbi:MAG: SAM-dependent methyltransferase [Gammaproteobacteria bacterium]|jgi:SAM-dependent methyltransferase
MSDVDNATRACPLCGNENARTIATMRAEQIVNSSPYYSDSSYDRLLVEAHDRFGVSQCQRCDFAFASNVPSDDFLSRLYGGHGNSNSDLEASVGVFARPDRAAYAFRALSRLLQVIAQTTTVDSMGATNGPIRILDVGCAYAVGSLGLIQHHYPYEVVGVEVSEATRNYLANQGMTSYAQLCDVPPDTVFDGILLNDVLEHVATPLDFVRQLKRLSDEQTAIWVNVPNFIDWRLAKIVEQVNSGSMDVPTDFNPWEHLSYFSPQSLDAVMNTIGARRLLERPVEYPVTCDSIVELLQTWLRATRDVWRIYARTYPQNFSTSGIFVFST